MSVYTTDKSPYYQYDFTFKRRRFYGTTGILKSGHEHKEEKDLTTAEKTKVVAARKKALAVEQNLREDAAMGKLDQAAPMTLNEAAVRWLKENGKGLRSIDDRGRGITVCLELLGRTTPITEVTTEKVSVAIQRRRQMTYTRAPGKNAKHYSPSNTTVNRDVIDSLRPILRAARISWGVKNLPEVDWGRLRLQEPKAKALEFTPSDLEAITAACRGHWAPFIDFMSRYGLRIGEMFFPLTALDIADHDNARLTLRGRKGGDDKVLPLLPQDAEMFADRLRRARAAELDTVWFREGKRRKFEVAPSLKADTYNGAEIALRRAMTRTGLRKAKGAKGAHGLRHHAGMKALRETRNLRTVQRLLGHADIRSTLVYADADENDVKEALFGVSRNSPGQAPDPHRKTNNI